MDIQTSTITIYIYKIVDNDLKVERMEYSKAWINSFFLEQNS